MDEGTIALVEAYLDGYFEMDGQQWKERPLSVDAHSRLADGDKILCLYGRHTRKSLVLSETSSCFLHVFLSVSINSNDVLMAPWFVRTGVLFMRCQF